MREGKPYSERWFGTLVTIVSGAGTFWVAWKWSDSPSSFLDAAQKLAFVNGGFIVAAFNLRFKMLDIIAKDWFKKSEFEELTRTMKSCAGRINRQIVYYTLVSAAMAAAPLAQVLKPLGGSIVVAFAFALFALGMTKFLQLLISFSRLESLACTAIRREIERKDLEKQRALFSDDDDK